MIDPALLFAIASLALADPKTVRRWARGGEERARMKASTRTRIERAATDLGYPLPVVSPLGSKGARRP